MTLHATDLQGGYTSEQLEQAFALVKPAGNWKLPIRATVPPDTDMDLLDFAIGYYTGGGITGQENLGDGILVRAAGYYANIGS